MKHSTSPVTRLTIGGTVLKVSDDLVILWVTFDSKMTFEEHLRSVSRAASQRLGILRKSWQVFHDICFLGGAVYRGFVLPVLEYCSVESCSAADTHLKLLDRVFSGGSFSTGGVFECDLVHRWSEVWPVAHSLWCSSCAACAGADNSTLMLLLAAEPRSIAGLLIPFQYLFGTILVTPYSMVWDWRVSEQGKFFFIGQSARSLFVSPCFPFLFFHSMGWYCGAGVFGLMGC